MPLKKQPFRKYNLEDNKQDIINVYINKEERQQLNEAKLILEQRKDSTAIKQLAWIGANIIVDDKMANILGIVFKNKRRNKRLGIVDFE